MKTEKELISEYAKIIGARGGKKSGVLRTPAQIKARRENAKKARSVKCKMAIGKRKTAKMKVKK